MFKWLYRKLYRGIMTEFEENKSVFIQENMVDLISFLQENEEFGAFMTLTTDIMMERGIQQLNRSFGGITKGLNASVQEGVEEANPMAGALMKWQKTGKMDLKSVIVPLLLQNLTGGGKGLDLGQLLKPTGSNIVSSNKRIFG